MKWLAAVVIVCLVGMAVQAAEAKVAAPGISGAGGMQSAATDPVAIPKPATAALLGLGTAALAIYRKRQFH